MTKMSFGKVAVLGSLCALIAACSSTTGPKVDPSTGTAPSPREVTPNPHEKIGNPYFVSGIRYVPREQPNYDQTGIASWYGPKFHGRLTANGEVFDMNRLSAAHKTLPLPSIVRVTNTKNNRSVIVRLNDRGPFSGERIIDLSRKTAEILGMREQGVGEVRVEYLGPASLDHAIVALGEPEDYAALEPPRRSRRSNPVRVASRPAPSVTPPPVVEPVVVASSATEEVTLPDLTAPTSSEAPIEIVDSRVDLPPLEDSLDMPENPSSATPERTMPVEGYYVQVGVFTNPQNADAAASKFNAVIPLSLDDISVGEETRQRLRMGPYVHEFAAEAAMKEAHNQGFTDAHIVRDGVLF